MSDQIVEWAKELQSLAQVGLFYGKDIYDRERYQRIREISTEMMACRTGIPTETITDLFCGDVGYQTHPRLTQERPFFGREKSFWYVKRENGASRADGVSTTYHPRKTRSKKPAKKPGWMSS